jgi:uncharacterized protein with PQ loop repeat
MTREEFAQKINWLKIVSVVGFVNPFMMVPQLIKLWRTHEATGISIITLLIIMIIQGSFGLHGFFIRDRMLMWSNGTASFATLATILSALYFS